MRKAFHQVWGISVKELLERGSLKPAIDHIDPSFIADSCFDAVDDLQMEMIRKDRAVSYEAVEVLHEIVQHEAQMVEEYQREEGITGRSTHSNLTCLDILANDFDKIFCSAFNWIDPSMNPSGFVFDADFLLDKRATLRSDDLIETYKEAIKTVLTETMNRYEYREAFGDVIEKVLRDNELTGSVAKAFLDRVEKREKADAKKGRKGTIEIVWGVELPLEWVKEVWQDGKRIE